MNDYTVDGSDSIYNVWNADPSTPIYKNEMLRNLHILRLMNSMGSFNSVLDIGCGTGYLDYLLAKSGKKVTGVDLSAKRLSLCSVIAKKYHIQQVNKNLFDLDEKDYDFVISQEVLEHLEDYESALLKMNSFIRSGGQNLFRLIEENSEIFIKMMQSFLLPDHYLISFLPYLFISFLFF